MHTSGLETEKIDVMVQDGVENRRSGHNLVQFETKPLQRMIEHLSCGLASEVSVRRPLVAWMNAHSWKSEAYAVTRGEW